VVAHNDGTEITDLMVPYALLSAAGATVSVAAPEDGPVSLWPALTLLPDTTLADADEADLIVVPAVHHHDDPRLLDWLRRQAAAGVPIASICDGVFLLAEAGLLDCRNATGHFYSHDKRLNAYPRVTWVRDVRYVEDGPFLSSAGVSAAGPASLHLVARLLGPDAAAAVAVRYGVEPGAGHRSDDYRIGAAAAVTAIGNYLQGIAKRRYLLDVQDGVDEYSLAYTTDMLARTSRVRITLAADEREVRSAFGLRLVAGRHAGSGRRVLLPPARSPLPPADLVIGTPANALPVLMDHLTREFGGRTANFVATQLELPWPASPEP
jgi:putative intracellular protease/amidase